jgi:fructose-1,6-bisphosphatase/inositol monophosphatase family enzyme
MNEKEFIDTSLAVAASIRENVLLLTDNERREKSTSTEFSNQYAIDVTADEICQSGYSHFGGYVLSEERTIDKAQLESSEQVIVVDPIDGSTNASKGLPYWSFSAAFVDKGNVSAAVVVDQGSQRVFCATSSKSTLQSLDRDPIDLAEIHAGETGTRANNFASATICFNSHDGPSIPFRHLRNFGSSALAICDVAAGGFDAYIDDEDILLKPWDLLAAEFIAQQAGCVVRRRDSSGIFAATGVLVARSKELLGEFSHIFPTFFRN